MAASRLESGTTQAAEEAEQATWSTRARAMPHRPRDRDRRGI